MCVNDFNTIEFTTGQISIAAAGKLFGFKFNVVHFIAFTVSVFKYNVLCSKPFSRHKYYTLVISIEKLHPRRHPIQFAVE